ncbi:MAG: hypothetical protein UT05_C0005G0031 [Parcubacteria group bacterium GW2011_GWF2_38_76]|nr:MAG: hypothetical protein UT05_C0005G0031 [Parcubacteria group bacterium GW2011_GWF2_38_76]HBM45602.1 hypothetical protein [Patescibacteria group bacterium]
MQKILNFLGFLSIFVLCTIIFIPSVVLVLGSVGFPLIGPGSDELYNALLIQVVILLDFFISLYVYKKISHRNPEKIDLTQKHVTFLEIILKKETLSIIANDKIRMWVFTVAMSSALMLFVLPSYTIIFSAIALPPMFTGYGTKVVPLRLFLLDGSFILIFLIILRFIYFRINKYKTILPGPNNELNDFILKRQSERFSKEQIEQELMSGGGWNKNDIDNIFNNIGNIK